LTRLNAPLDSLVSVSLMNTNPKTSMLSSYSSRLISRNDSNTQSLALIQPTEQLDRPTKQQQKTIAYIYSEQAQIYFQEKNWDKAIAACKNSLDIVPDNVDAFRILGNILLRQGKKPEALGIYAKALSINPNSASIYANLGSFYAGQKHWKQALDYFQQAVIFDPNLAGAYRSLAQIWEELGDKNQALECFCQAINLDPQILTAEEYFGFGAELYQQGKTKEASIFYIQGTKLNPQAKVELAKLVEILEELEEWQQAVTYYHQLMSISDSSDDLSLKVQDKPITRLLSRSKSTAKNIDNQKKDIKAIGASSGSNSQILTKNILPAASMIPAKGEKPNSAISWNNLGSLCAQRQQWNKAIRCYQAAIQLEPAFSKTYRNLARVYQKLGNESKAALCWYKAFSLEPQQVKLEEYFSLAKNLLEFGQVNKAISCLRRTIEIKPNFQQAHLILGKLFEKRAANSQ